MIEFIQFVVFFTLGFLIGEAINNRRLIKLYLYLFFLRIYGAVYYRPKIRKYQRLLIKNGWELTSSSNAVYQRWNHPNHGEQTFHTACCLMLGIESSEFDKAPFL
jgi:hypothetical protein